jgi:hypothetical protein
MKSFTFFTSTVPGAGVLFANISFAGFWTTRSPLRIMKIGYMVRRVTSPGADFIQGSGEVNIASTLPSTIINTSPPGININIVTTSILKDFAAGGDSEQWVNSPIIPANSTLDLTLSVYGYGNPGAADTVFGLLTLFYEYPGEQEMQVPLVPLPQDFKNKLKLQKELIAKKR